VFEFKEEPPIAHFINSFENSMKELLKLDISKNFIQISKYNYDFENIWKRVASKQISIQAMLTINDLCFFHDLSAIITAYDNTDSEGKRFLGSLRGLIEERYDNFFHFFNKFFLKLGVQKYVLNSYMMLSMQVQHHLELIRFFERLKTININSFEYFSLPKLSLECSNTVLDSSFKNMEGYKENLRENFQSANPCYNTSSMDCGIYKNGILKDKKIDIVLLSMNNKLQYGYELVDYAERLYITPTVDKIFFQLLSCLSFNSGALMRGPEASGKSYIFKVGSTDYLNLIDIKLNTIKKVYMKKKEIFFFLYL
jgi:hypothetical protein